MTITATIIVVAVGLAIAAQFAIVRLADIAVFAVWKRMIPHIPSAKPRRHNRQARREEWRNYCDKHGFISWGEYLCRK